MTKYTTILISVETREALKNYGRKGETYEDLLRRLLKEAKKK